MSRFTLAQKTAIITGGAGLLGVRHAEALAELGACTVLWDCQGDCAKEQAATLQQAYNVPAYGMRVDVTSSQDISQALRTVVEKCGGIDILINNAAVNPTMEGTASLAQNRLEHFPIEQWNKEIAVGLTGAMVCSQIIGASMAEHGGGVILNISSDLGVIAPDQRIYKMPSISDSEQPVKPVTYSVIKHGLIGLTKYCATYWADKHIRVNTLCPGGVSNGQDAAFVKKLSNLIPMGRMANPDEYKGAVQFLCSEASSYMTGSCLVIDGGRTCW